MTFELEQRIREAAYYKWLANDGFVDSETCWLEAEREVLEALENDDWSDVQSMDSRTIKELVAYMIKHDRMN
jgi:hypothetical protein